jgi:putative hydrolase of the HAD superfamily
MEEMASALKLNPEDFHAEWVKGFEQRMDGTLPDGDEQFIPILQALGREIVLEQLAEATEIRRRLWLSALQPKPESVACLQQLRQAGFKLALASDCSSDTPNLLNQTPLGEFFPVRAISAHLRTRKPDPRMYRYILEAYALEGPDCLYVGDGNSDELPGAKRAGMTTVWVDNGEAQHFKERYHPGGDHRVSNLLEILDILRKHPGSNF